jgi:hypothetical protein
MSPPKMGDEKRRWQMRSQNKAFQRPSGPQLVSRLRSKEAGCSTCIHMASLPVACNARENSYST